MMPQIMSVIQVRFNGAARARALSAYTAVLSSGFVVGQVVGSAGHRGPARLGRPVSLVNVPIGLAVLALAPRLVPRDAPSGRLRLDPRGLSVAVPAVFLVVLPLMLGHQRAGKTQRRAGKHRSFAYAIVAIYRGSHYRLWLEESVASGYDMRVGDAERDAAANELREHFASGRLTQDELNERLDQTFAAKTRAELSGLFTDLPSSTWQDAPARGMASGPYGANGLLGRPAEQWTGWGGRTSAGADDPFGDSGAGSAGGPGGYGRRALGMAVVPLVLFAALIGLGIFAIFGIGGGPRPFGFVLILAAFALLRRLVFFIFGRRRGGSRRGGGGGPRRRRR